MAANDLVLKVLVQAPVSISRPVFGFTDSFDTKLCNIQNENQFAHQNICSLMFSDEYKISENSKENFL